MKRLLIILCLVLLPSIVNAQNISTTTCPGAGCTDLPVGGQGSIGIQITGTWSGTITFSASVDGTNYVTMLVAPVASGTAVSTTTSNGIWTAAIAGITNVRVAFTSYSSGTATVTRRTTQAARNGGTSGGGGSGGTVTSVGLSGPDLFTYGSAVTSSGTLTFTPTDPDADKIVFWDDSAGKWQYLAVGTGLAITGTTIDNTIGASGGTTDLGGGINVSGTQTCTTTNCSLSVLTPVVYCDASSNSVNLNLPAVTNHATFTSISRIDSTAANTCTLVAGGGDNINGDSTVLVTPGVSYALIGKGSTQWRITSSNIPAAATHVLGITVDGGGTVISTGVKGDVYVPFTTTITANTVLCDASGSIVFDIWVDTYANYPPTVADTITASAKPTISSATKSQDTTLTGWTKSLAAGSTVRFNVDSASTVTRCVLTLTLK